MGLQHRQICFLVGTLRVTNFGEQHLLLATQTSGVVMSLDAQPQTESFKLSAIRYSVACPCRVIERGITTAGVVRSPSAGEAESLHPSALLRRYDRRGQNSSIFTICDRKGLSQSWATEVPLPFYLTGNSRSPSLLKFLI